MSRKHAILYGASFLCAAFLTGCGIGPASTSGGGTIALSGQVHGGQQGVVGSTIQLYSVGSGGNGTAAVALLDHTVTTGAGGSFNLNGDYSCTSPTNSGNPVSLSNQVYIVATGGDPGVGSNNAALTMVAALGPCSSLTDNTNVYINELTTVAAAWALAPFATSSANIAASSTNVTGLSNAFLDAGLLVNFSTGAPATLPGNLSIETGKLNALADALASCVNSNGGSACTPLFTAANEGSTPTDTFSAALHIVKHPGTNVAKVFNAIGTYVPFATSMDAPPNDWTMSLTVTGGGLSSPTALGVDAEGNVWVTNYNGPLSAFGPQGTPMSDTGFTDGGLSQSYGLTIDTNGDVWVANNTGGPNGNGSVSKFLGATSTLGSAGTVVSSGYTNYINYPFALASDTNGNVFVANSQNGSATVLTTNGTVYTTPDNTFSGYLELGFGFPIQSIAVDTNHGFWMPNGDHVVGHFSADGAQESLTNCCFGAQALALDNTGAVWVANYDGNTISELDSTGTVHVNQKAPGGIDSPDDISIDSSQNVWISNNNSDGFSISEVAGNGSTLPLGTGISPSNAQGVYGQGGFGLDANLDFPFGLAPDRSGNIWVSNEHNDSLVMFFGIATPTITPIQPAPSAP